MHDGSELVKKWRKTDVLIRKVLYNVTNLFPKNKLQYTYINTFMLCLFFTFIHKYLDQTLPSLYKSIENDFNIDVKTLYYMNTIYKLSYAAFNFFFALFFDYTFKKGFCKKFRSVDNVYWNNSSTIDDHCDGGNGNIQYEVCFKNENEQKEKKSRYMTSINAKGDNKKFMSVNGKKGDEMDKKKTHVEEESKCEVLINENEEVTLGEYCYTLNILTVSSIVYIIVIYGIMVSKNFIYFFFFMFIMGINNSCIYILVQKIYTNKVFSENRSTIFGFLHFFSSISHMLSISINTNLSNKIYLGFNGWRICYFIISFFPICVCIYILRLIKQNKLRKNNNRNMSRSKGKGGSLSYMVSFDNLTDANKQKGEDSKYFKKRSNRLSSFRASCLEKGQIRGIGGGREGEEEEEVSLLNANETICKNYTDSEYKVELSHEENKNFSQVKNVNIFTSPEEVITGGDYNSTSLISDNDKMAIHVVKRTLSNVSSKRDKGKESQNSDNTRSGDDPVNDNNHKEEVKSASRSSASGTRVRRKSTKDRDDNSVKNGEKSENDKNDKNDKKDKNYTHDTRCTEKESPSSSIFTNYTDEREKCGQRDELDNLLENGEKGKGKKQKYEFSYLYEIRYVFKNYSFWLMITMGMLNGIPKHVLSLMIYFFQYCNISDFKSGFIISVSWLCASLVSPFIGIISDYIYRLNKDINRQLIGMCTHFLRIILMFTLFFFIPKEAESFTYFVIISLFMGILSGWINIGTHKPILIDIVKQRHTAFVMALMNAFENIGSSIIGTFFLSFLLNRYNYIDKKRISTFNANVNKHNVHVLADVLLILTCFPWLMSLCLLYILKFTYKKDKLYNNIF
ncbi:major facilitator superfamily domain-containing protein, putative [Plasmodium ovale]|uniref:Major facilitator superfamily domain-containing protein, putative n=1 Tax=Plasmodium ovale TaxID=36330 RepID=A0A1D3TMJ8_PLAOA|nr:major facilitator superfamily domain-containing protein, putative [Plasmodium ovale]